ncbi:alpha/beta fold hydrolase [Halorhodospira halochloris]|uniref:YqiA/YcfP family alpha/beta fold hydrolase n=1 Tax=Halorhodospira halochloris TaxID=1052 RepID=UPI001EE83505|nr:YqiA/YcfP family alpha/beta fold hydrolase [Halorhodospira halochloris]MCG5530054.1 alpha/beta fold hydrolase [Halorhodospira halochloris]
MIIYIHGFGGSGRSRKAVVLRRLLQDENFLAPSLPNHPRLALETLSEIVEYVTRFEPVGVIGSSLGGFYALCLSEWFPELRAVLINPALRPYETLRCALGSTGGVELHDGSRYEWHEGHLEALKELAPERYCTQNLLLLSQLGDELLDAREAIEALDGCAQVVEEGGSHGFDGVERYVGRIREFFEVSSNVT